MGFASRGAQKISFSRPRLSQTSEHAHCGLRRQSQHEKFGGSDNMAVFSTSSARDTSKTKKLTRITNALFSGMLAMLLLFSKLCLVSGWIPTQHQEYTKLQQKSRLITLLPTRIRARQSGILYVRFLDRFAPKQAENNQEYAPETLFPAIQDAIREHTQDESTLNELQALDASLQRLAVAKEGFFAIMAQEGQKATTEATNSGASIADATGGVTNSNDNINGVSVMDLDELERIVTQLEEEASNSDLKQPVSRSSVSSLSTNVVGEKAVSDYREMIASLEAQVEQISKDHQALFLQQNSQQAPSTSSLSPLRSLEEINKDLALAQKYQTVNQEDNVQNGSSPEESSSSNASTSFISQQFSNFTQEVSSSFANWKDELVTVLEDVKQDGTALDLTVQLQTQLELSLDSEENNNGTQYGSAMSFSASETATQQQQKPWFSLAARFWKVWKGQVKQVRSQVEEYEAQDPEREQKFTPSNREDELEKE